MACDGILDREGHRDDRGEVEHRVEAFGHDPAHRFVVAHIPLDERDPEARQVLTLAGREVVEDHDLVARAYEALGGVGADEAGPAGDEDPKR
ncbi:hypothetical protein D3C87_1955730 [compost metagenome]